MWRLHQFPLCPFSRKVRLLLSEKGVPYELARAHPWSPSEEFLDKSHAGRTPMLEDTERGLVLADSRAICEYFEETERDKPFLPGTAADRAEVRRLVALFDEELFGNVTGPLLHERMKKRLFTREPPDSRVLREVMKLAHQQLDYIDWLVDTRNWLAGARMSFADLAAAAQLSVADYLDGIDWAGHDQARQWYGTFKCRPSFRPLLAERMEGIRPPAHYADPDA